MGTSLEAGFQLEPVNGPSVIDVGLGQQPLQDIYETSAAQKHGLDTLLKYPDGRKFRYALNGAVALSKALMCQSAVLATDYSKFMEIVQTGTGANVAVGDQEIIVTVTTGSAIEDNAFAGGYMIVNKATGIGDFYKVVASKLTATDTLLRVLLETPIRTALGATSEITLQPSLRYKVLVQATTLTGPVVGVPLVAVPIGYYCWLQTAGVCPGLVDASDTIVIGEPVGKPGTNGTAGGFGVVANDGTDAVYGRAIYVATTAEAALIDLHLE